MCRKGHVLPGFYKKTEVLWMEMLDISHLVEKRHIYSSMSCCLWSIKNYRVSLDGLKMEWYHAKIHTLFQGKNETFGLMKHKHVQHFKAGEVQWDGWSWILPCCLWACLILLLVELPLALAPSTVERWIPSSSAEKEYQNPFFSPAESLGVHPQGTGQAVSRKHRSQWGEGHPERLSEATKPALSFGVI